MVENDLIRKVRNTNLKKVLSKKGYVYFTKGLYNLNIIAVRKDNNNKVTNLYDDVLCVEYSDETGSKKLLYNITTEPGTYWMKEQLGNSKGTAIVVPDQYRSCWKIGKHHGIYKALVQSKPIKVYRDGNKDDIFDLNPTRIFKGLFGINIHRSNQAWTRLTIDKYSGGCQVFNNPKDFAEFINICEEQRKRYGNSFTYTLIDEKDLELGK